MHELSVYNSQCYREVAMCFFLAFRGNHCTKCKCIGCAAMVVYNVCYNGGGAAHVMYNVM